MIKISLAYLCGFRLKSKITFLSIIIFIGISNPAQACLEIPTTPPDMNVETCNFFPELSPSEYSILRLLNYTTYGANTDEFCACALNLPLQIGRVDSAAIVFAGTNTLVSGWSFVQDDDTDFGSPGTDWQGFSSTVDDFIPSDIEVDIVFIIATFCDEIPSRQGAACCDLSGEQLLDWFVTGDGLIGTDGANPDGSPIGAGNDGSHTYIDEVGNVVLIDPSCLDGVINGDEEGFFMDDGLLFNCGGFECPPCETQLIELMDPCSCDSDYIPGVGFEDALEIIITPGDQAVLEVNNGGFTNPSGIDIPVGTVFEDGGMFDEDGVVNGFIIVQFFRDEGESANITVSGVSFLSPAPCPFIADCNVCDVDGGNVSGFAEVCFQMGIADINFSASGQTGANNMWILFQGDIIFSVSTFPEGLDFDCCGPGTFDVAVVSYEDGLTGLFQNGSISNLVGCFAISNSQSAIVELVDSGILVQSIDPIEFCVGDGVSDVLSSSDVMLFGPSGQQFTWFITDESFFITEVASDVSEFDFDSSAPGICFLFHGTYTNLSSGISVGQNVSEIGGCASVSNSIQITKEICGVCEVQGGTLSRGPFADGPFLFCVDDGNPDVILDEDLSLTGNVGPNSVWVLTDNQGNIQELENSLEDFDFEGYEGSETATCLIWHLSYEDGLQGAEVGMNAADLSGCFSLSNSQAITKILCDNCDELNGGMITGGPFTFLTGDANPDIIPTDEIILTGNIGEAAGWLLTDEEGVILLISDLPTLEIIDFDLFDECATYNIWHISFISGETIGGNFEENINDLEGCFSLSNPINVNVSSTSGGTLTGGPYTFCAGDGNPDFIMTDDLTLSGNVGANSAWVITDEQLNILSLPTAPEDVDFELAGAGTCLIWNVSFEDGLQGAEVGMNAANLEGCFSLSNSIEVFRIECCIPEDVCAAVDLSDLSGSTNAEQDFNAANLTTGSAVVTLTRQLNGTAIFDENQINASQTTGDLAIRLGVDIAVGPSNNLTSTYTFSEPVCEFDLQIWDLDQTDVIIVNASLNGAPVTYTSILGSCAGQSGDMFTPNGAACQVQVSGDPNHSFTIEMDDCIDEFEIIIYDQGAGTGGSYSLVLGDGCTEGVEPLGGTISGGPYGFCVNDGSPDLINTDDFTLTGNAGQFSSWILTDDELNILDFPEDPTSIDFDGGGFGTCLLWNISYNGEIQGLSEGQNAANLDGCFALSNSILINKIGCCLDAFCSSPDISALDGTNENAEAVFNAANVTIANSFVSLTRSLSGSAAYDENEINTSQTNGDVGIRLGVVNAVGAANSLTATYNMSEPVCDLIITLWDIDRTDELVVSASINGVNVSYNAILGSCVVQSGNIFNPNGIACEIQANPVEDHAVDIIFNGCIDQFVIQNYDQGGGNGGSYSLVIGEGCDDPNPNGGVLTGGPYEFCVSDNEPDFIMSDDLTLTGESGANSAWVITDENLNILALPLAPEDVNFQSAGSGTCLIWHLSFENGLLGAEVGENAEDLIGCYDLSNPITVIRNEVDGGELTGGPYQFCVGDGEADFILTDDLVLTGSVGSTIWLLTDPNLIILEISSNPTSINFDDDDPGNCLLWALSFDNSIQGVTIGESALNLSGCFQLSNSISIVKEICADPCEENLFIGGNIDPNLYEASNTITSTGIVNQTPVDFSAGQCISLESEFEVTLGNVFHAFIIGCED